MSGEIGIKAAEAVEAEEAAAVEHEDPKKEVNGVIGKIGMDGLTAGKVIIGKVIIAGGSTISTRVQSMSQWKREMITAQPWNFSTIYPMKLLSRFWKVLRNFTVSEERPSNKIFNEIRAAVHEWKEANRAFHSRIVWEK